MFTFCLLLSLLEMFFILLLSILSNPYGSLLRLLLLSLSSSLSLLLLLLLLLLLNQNEVASGRFFVVYVCYFRSTSCSYDGFSPSRLLGKNTSLLGSESQVPVIVCIGR